MNEFKKFLRELSDDDVLIEYDSNCKYGYLTVWFEGHEDRICTIFYEVDNTVGACKERAYEIYKRLGGTN